MKKIFGFTPKKLLTCIIGGVTAGFFNGLFGSGGGTIIVPFLEKFLELEPKKSHATAILIILGFTSVSLIFYGFSKTLDFPLALKVSIGGVLGGILGAKLLAKLSSGTIHKIFGLFMIIASVRMVFFS
ncbi:MAG: sulfite exporter TauE/SafE family protein [Clostridia bacterium]|nr:sulfite exporter TauE/SafE family protein [Clostridia bacterium]